MKQHFALLFLAGFAALIQAGCALVGNVKPIDEKSSTYGVMDLSKTSEDWQQLKHADVSDKADKDSQSAGDVGDVAYQSKKTASIISLDSACRTSNKTHEQSLRALTDQLIQGISDVNMREEAKGFLHGQPILQTTINGKSNGEDIALRAIVLQKGSCVYDLMYVARPQHFQADTEFFTKFVDSLRVK